MKQDTPKLPLAEGSKTTKSKAPVFFIIVILLCLSLFTALKMLSPKAMVSTNATVSGNIVRVLAPVAEKISFIAKAGQRVKVGDDLIKFDSQSLQTKLDEETKKLRALQQKLPPEVPALLDRYIQIPESVKTLQEMLTQAERQEKDAQEAVAKASVEQASILRSQYSFELNVPLNENSRDQYSSFVEEAVKAEDKVKMTRLQQEGKSAKRASLNKRLKEKKRLEQALQYYLASHGETVGSMLSLLGDLQQTSIAETGFTATQAGTVLYANKNAGEAATLGEELLAILPEAEQTIWVRANFEPALAGDIELGESCTISGKNSQQFFEGFVAARLDDTNTANSALPSSAPATEQPAADKVPVEATALVAFKITITELDNEKLAKILVENDNKLVVTITR